jgi:hypothetical protein
MQSSRVAPMGRMAERNVSACDQVIKLYFNLKTLAANIRLLLHHGRRVPETFRSWHEQGVEGWSGAPRQLAGGALRRNHDCFSSMCGILSRIMWRIDLDLQSYSRCNGRVTGD